MPACPQDVMVGAECMGVQQQLELSYPMKNGVVQSWDDMSLIWDVSMGLAHTHKVGWDPKMNCGTHYMPAAEFSERHRSCM